MNSENLVSSLEIEAEVTRRDLVAMNFYLMPRLKANWIFLLVVWVVMIGAVIYGVDRPLSPKDFKFILFDSAKGAIIAVALGQLVCLVMMLLMANEKSGHIGKHKFKIDELHFVEETKSNQTRTEWSGILSAHKTNAFILVRISSFLFHAIPKRSFSSASHYDLFLNDIRNRIAVSKESSQ